MGADGKPNEFPLATTGRVKSTSLSQPTLSGEEPPLAVSFAAIQANGIVLHPLFPDHKPLSSLAV